MPRKYSRRVSPEKKAEALRKHLKENIPVSKICNDLDIQPSVFYGWEKELFLRCHSLFDTKPGPKKKDTSGETIASLEAKIKDKDSIVAELLGEHIALKKKLGVK